MKKKELIERFAQEAGAPRSEAQKHFEAFEEVVTEALKAGEEVQITGFGKFSVRERKAREGRNPQTGQKMKMRPRRSPPSARATPSKRQSRRLRPGGLLDRGNETGTVPGTQ